MLEMAPLNLLPELTFNLSLIRARDTDELRRVRDAMTIPHYLIETFTKMSEMFRIPGNDNASIEERFHYYISQFLDKDDLISYMRRYRETSPDTAVERGNPPDVDPRNERKKQKQVEGIRQERREERQEERREDRRDSRRDEKRVEENVRDKKARKKEKKEKELQKMLSKLLELERLKKKEKKRIPEISRFNRLWLEEKKMDLASSFVSTRTTHLSMQT